MYLSQIDTCQRVDLIAIYVARDIQMRLFNVPKSVLITLDNSVKLLARVDYFGLMLATFGPCLQLWQIEKTEPGDLCGASAKVFIQTGTASTHFKKIFLWCWSVCSSNPKETQIHRKSDSLSPATQICAQEKSTRKSGQNFDKLSSGTQMCTCFPVPRKSVQM